MQIPSSRPSNKTPRLRPRHVVPKPAQAYEPEVPVKVRDWIGPAPASPGFVLDAQPPARRLSTAHAKSSPLSPRKGRLVSMLKAGVRCSSPLRGKTLNVCKVISFDKLLQR